MAGEITNVLMVGVGGQGIITASDILSLAALYAGHDAKKSEIHGMSQRGGSVFAHVRFGPRVYSPIIPEGEADVLLSLELMETLRWLSYANRDTQLVVSRLQMLPANVESYPAGVEEEIRRLSPQTFFVDPKELAQKIGDAKYGNVALLGLLSARVGFPDDAWQRAIRENVPRGTDEANWKAFGIGKTLLS